MFVFHQVAALCAQNSPENRPTMQEVVEMLKEDHLKDGPVKKLPDKVNGGLHLEPVKYDPALLAADDGPGFGSRKSPITAF